MTGRLVLARKAAARRVRILVLAVAAFMLIGAGPAAAVEVGEPAPEFTMPSTMGGNVSLSDYRDKKWVLLEFYGADFAPT
jgi:hypothetical protein